MSRDVLKSLMDDSVAALRCMGDAWPRSLLSSTKVPPDWVVLLENAEGRRRVIPGGDELRPESEDKLFFVRRRSMSVSLSVENVEAAQGNLVNGECELILSWSRGDDDLSSARTRVMDQAVLTIDRLNKTLDDAGGSQALLRFISSRPADELVRDDLREALRDTLRESLRQFLFTSGLLLERVASVKFASKTLAEQQSRRRETERRLERVKTRDMVEKAAFAATQRRLDDLRGVLDKLKAASSDADTQWHDLLPALSPAERGRLLENLWRITPDQRVAEAIVVVAGNEVVWLDVCEPEKIVRRVALSDEMGGLRSVEFSADDRRLLVGAAKGVWLLSASDGSVVDRFEAPDAGEPRTGFNAAAICNGRLFATHSQLGCWSWQLDDPSEATSVLRPENGVPKTIRAVTPVGDGRVLFAADNMVMVVGGSESEGSPSAAADGWPSASAVGDTNRPQDERCETDNAGPDDSSAPPPQAMGRPLVLRELTPASATIHALCVLDARDVYAATSDGKILRHAIDGSGEWSLVHRGRERAESIVARRWNDLVELVVPAGDEGVVGVFGGEGVVARLLRSNTAIRRAWACDDMVVGLSDRRDRLIVMNANMPERTGREAPVSRMLGHSLQDVCIVVRHEGTQKGGPRSAGVA